MGTWQRAKGPKVCLDQLEAAEDGSAPSASRGGGTDPPAAQSILPYYPIISVLSETGQSILVPISCQGRFDVFVQSTA